MRVVEMIMPELGESILEGKILTWLKKEGESIQEEEPLLEVATDKVDTEIVSSHTGLLKKYLFQKGEYIKIGKAIALIEVEGEKNRDNHPDNLNSFEESTENLQKPKLSKQNILEKEFEGKSKRFYSPLVKKIASEEQIRHVELEKIKGQGQDGRVTKDDILNYIKIKKNSSITNPQTNTLDIQPALKSKSIYVPLESDEIIEMDRIQQMMAERMIESKNTAVHATIFSEVDITRMAKWRDKVKQSFYQKENVKLTFTPFLIEAVVQAIKDYDLINISIQDNKIIRKKHINIGMATALPNGKLIVPVIHRADTYSLKGLAVKVSDLAYQARNNILAAQDLGNATYTISNIGMFNALMGTPIILQPQVAIMAFGAIKKKVVVIDTPEGETIGIRHKMYLSHSFDHRIVDGALGSLFCQRVAEYIENFNDTQSI